MRKYDRHQIADELHATAMGQAYYGNALLVALDIPCGSMTLELRHCLMRWLDGSQCRTDFHDLQHIANLIRADGIDP